MAPTGTARLRRFSCAINAVEPSLAEAWFGACSQAEGRTLAEVEAAAAANLLMDRLPTADDVAQVIAFLASPRSVTANGVAVDVGGSVRGSITY